jgi:hypothetical protein
MDAQDVKGMVSEWPGSCGRTRPADKATAQRRALIVVIFLSLRTRVSAFLSHRTLHQQYRERDYKGQHSRHPKGVEICQRRRLLLTQVIELLHSQLLGGGRIAVLLNEERLSPREKAAGGGVEGIKILPKP